MTSYLQKPNVRHSYDVFPLKRIFKDEAPLLKEEVRKEEGGRKGGGKREEGVRREDRGERSEEGGGRREEGVGRREEGGGRREEGVRMEEGRREEEDGRRVYLNLSELGGIKEEDDGGIGELKRSILLLQAENKTLQEGKLYYEELFRGEEKKYAAVRTDMHFKQQLIEKKNEHIR